LGVTEVLPTNEARAKLNQIAAGFDHDGPDAAPVVFGSRGGWVTGGDGADGD
jgi:hypothetical protein